MVSVVNICSHALLYYNVLVQARIQERSNHSSGFSEVGSVGVLPQTLGFLDLKGAEMAASTM